MLLILLIMLFLSGIMPEEIPDLEIRVAALLLTGIFMVMSTVAVKKVNGEN